MQEGFSLLVHAFLPEKDVESHRLTSRDDHALLEEARNLLLGCSTHPINSGCQLSEEPKNERSRWRSALRQSEAVRTVARSDTLKSNHAYEYKAPPTLGDVPDLEDSFGLREEYLCPPGEEDLYLPRKRRKVEYSHRRRTLSTLRSWEAGSVTPYTGDEEKEDLRRTWELEEFQSSDFSFLSHLSRKPPNPQASGLSKTRSPHGNPDSPPEATSLYELIPQPHIHGSLIPHNNPKKKSKEPSLPPYKKSAPRYIPPYSSPPASPPAIHPLFQDPYSRTAWIVPINALFGGSPAGITSATLQWPPDPASSFASPTSNLDNNIIQWTPHAVLTFWEFLLRVREVRQAGSIGLSLHLAVPDELPLDSEHVGVPALSPRPDGQTSIGDTTLPTDVSLNATRQEVTRSGGSKGMWTLEQDYTVEEQAQPRSWFCSTSSLFPSASSEKSNDGADSSRHTDHEPDTSPPHSVEPDLRSVLARTDYIKIYHEARYAFIVRNVLHLWGYSPPPPSHAIAVDMDMDPDATTGRTESITDGGQDGGETRGQPSTKKSGKRNTFRMIGIYTIPREDAIKRAVVYFFDMSSEVRTWLNAMVVKLAIKKFLNQTRRRNVDDSLSVQEDIPQGGSAPLTVTHKMPVRHTKEEENSYIFTRPIPEDSENG